MILLKFDEVTDDILEDLEQILSDQEIAELAPPEGDDPPDSDLDPDQATFEGTAEEMLGHLEDRLSELQRTVAEFAEPLGGRPRTFYEVQHTALEDGRDPALRICLVLESPASPEKRLYFCDTVARVEENYYLAWDLPSPRESDLD